MSITPSAAPLSCGCDPTIDDDLSLAPAAPCCDPAAKQEDVTSGAGCCG